MKQPKKKLSSSARRKSPGADAAIAAAAAEEEQSSGNALGTMVAKSVPKPAGMQIYWSLSSVEASVREVAAGALVNELVGAQRDFDDKGLGQEERAADAVILGAPKTEEEGLKECAPAVQYALRRLIRGAASSREGARQGFALALACVLGAMSCVNGKAILKMVDKHLEVGSSAKGQEVRDSLLGQLFAYGSFVRGSQAVGDGSSSDQQELVKELTDRLLALARKKTFLRGAAFHVLRELGEKLGRSGLERGMCTAHLFVSALKEEPDSISPDVLFLALSLHHRLPESALQSCSLIPESGKLIDIFEEDQLLKMVTCLKESTSSHPGVHPLWDPLLQILISGGLVSKTPKKHKKRKNSETDGNLETRLRTFWTIVVDGSLLTSSHERKHLAMQLLLMLLPRLPAPSYAESVLSDSLLRCVLDARAVKQNLLFKSAENFIAEVCKWAEEDEERRIRLVIAFQLKTQGKFDQLSRTQSVRGLLSGLTTITSYQSIFEALSNIYMSVDSVEQASNSKKPKAVDGGNADTAQRRWTLDQLRSLCQQALGTLPARVAVEELIVKFVPLLAPVSPFSEEEEEAVMTLQSTMLQISAALSKGGAGEKNDRLQAMLCLLVQLLFESRLVPSVAVESATEITMCCRKAFGDLVELEGELQMEGEEPEFMDVLVDVLLSLLAQPSAPIRAAADQVFKSFSEDLTSSGLTDLLRIVKKNTQRTRHKPIVEVDMQQEDDEDIMDVEGSDESEETSVKGIGYEDDGTDNDMGSDSGDEDEEVPQASNAETPSRRNGDVTGELGDDGEDNAGEEEVSDLDDETMFKMDRHLAVMLKQRKMGDSNGTDESKDAQTQVLHFKFRVLALLEFFLQKHSGSMLVLTIFPSLLHVFVNSCTTDGNSQVADRVGSILQHKIFKGKQYPKGPAVDQTNLKDLARKALRLASRSTVKRVSKMAESACHWLLKVIQGNLKEGRDKDVEEMFSAALEDFFSHKKCRLSSGFFKESFVRHPWLGHFLLGNILEKCMSARSEFLRFESLQLASTILGFKNGKVVNKIRGDQSSLRFEAIPLMQHVQLLSKVVARLLKDAPSATKSARRSDALQFCVSSLELYQVLFPEKSLKEFVDSNDLERTLKQILVPAKTKLHNILVKLREFRKDE